MPISERAIVAREYVRHSCAFHSFESSRGSKLVGHKIVGSPPTQIIKPFLTSL